MDFILQNDTFSHRAKSCALQTLRMNMIRTFSKTLLAIALFTFLALTQTRAQSIWASGAAGNWNIASSWNPASVPDIGAAAFITNSGTYIVTYDSPMAAASIGSFTFGGSGTPTLNITANGFNVTGATTISSSSAGVINVNAGGVMNNGTLTMTSQSGIINVNGLMTNATTKVADNSNNDGAAALKVNPGAVAKSRQRFHWPQQPRHRCRPARSRWHGHREQHRHRRAQFVLQHGHQQQQHRNQRRQSPTRHLHRHRRPRSSFLPNQRQRHVRRHCRFQHRRELQHLVQRPGGSKFTAAGIRIFPTPSPASTRGSRTAARSISARPDLIY